MTRQRTSDKPSAISEVDALQESQAPVIAKGPEGVRRALPETVVAATSLDLKPDDRDRSTVAQFAYVDLFAGIGGFHAALSALGGECAFVSEIDEDAAKVYTHNWGPEVAWINPDDPNEPPVHGNIRDYAPEDGSVSVPKHDILAAGFPCQPFSKSGAQMGVRDRTRGTLFYNILRVLDERRPKVIFLENVRNLAGPRHTDTWDTIITSLREIGYRVSDKPTVLSPHLLHPRLGGSPQVRDRVFILGVYVGKEAAQQATDLPAAISRKPVDWDPQKWSLTDTPLPWNDDQPLLLDDATTPEADKYRLTRAEQRWIEVWDDFVIRLRDKTGKPLPGFPLWADEWYQTRDDLDAWIEREPDVWDDVPQWKRAFLRKNADFFTEHEAEIIKWRARWFPYWATGKDDRTRWTSVLLGHEGRVNEDISEGVFFPPSRRKLEWQAQDTLTLRECVLHLRPSGIRAKRATYLPALVAITQTSVLAWRNRRLMPREAARLQGLPDWYEFKHTDPDSGMVTDQPDAATYKQLGNGVAAGAIYYALRRFLLDNLDALTPALREVALLAPETPQVRRRAEDTAPVTSPVRSRPSAQPRT
jgi:DNA (cytosine-5)-methyltransferase 1